MLLALLSIATYSAFAMAIEYLKGKGSDGSLPRKRGPSGNFVGKPPFSQHAQRKRPAISRQIAQNSEFFYSRKFFGPSRPTIIPEGPKTRCEANNFVSGNLWLHLVCFFSGGNDKHVERIWARRNFFLV
jgi:hypothetical protein